MSHQSAAMKTNHRPLAWRRRKNGRKETEGATEGTRAGTLKRLNVSPRAKEPGGDGTAEGGCRRVSSFSVWGLKKCLFFLHRRGGLKEVSFFYRPWGLKKCLFFFGPRGGLKNVSSRAPFFLVFFIFFRRARRNIFFKPPPGPRRDIFFKPPRPKKRPLFKPPAAVQRDIFFKPPYRRRDPPCTPPAAEPSPSRPLRARQSETFSLFNVSCSNRFLRGFPPSHCGRFLSSPP